MNIFKYSHLSAKIRAMKGQMLTTDDYENMMQKRSVSEIANYLKNNTYYADALEDLDENNVHRAYLEMLLYRAEITDTLKIARYLKGNDKTIYRYVYRKQEIEDLKKMLRILQMGKSLENIDKKTLFISKYSKIDFKKSLQAKNTSELIESIKGTNFYKILKPLVISENEIDLFTAEMALDMYYFNRLIDDLKDIVHTSDKRIKNSIFGAEVDLRNIIWIYRGKKYYKVNKEMLYRYVIPYYSKISKQDITKMIGAKDEEELLKIIFSTYYKDLLGKDPSLWEKDLLRCLLKIQQKNAQQDPYSRAPIVGYIFMKETEIFNITAIIEGVRYQITQDEMKKQLIVL